MLLLLPGVAAAATGQSPFANIFFEPNRGQAPAAVHYLARAPHAALGFGDGGVKVDNGERLVLMQFAGANSAARFEPLDATADRTSYFLGRDASRWTRDVPHYRRLAWRGIYPGIDAIFYGSGGQLEFDLEIAPGADPGQVRLRFAGGDAVRIGSDGGVIVRAGKAEILMLKPRVYQRTKQGGEEPVEARFRRAGKGDVRLAMGAYDRARQLVVDPVLQFSSYYGGEKEDSVVAITAQGDVVGNTRSSSFSDGQRRTSTDVFVRMVLNQFSGELLYIFGGSDDDVATCATLSFWGLVIGGWTRSSDFVNGPGSGGVDGFLYLLTRDVRPVPTGTRIGGSGDDRILALAGSTGAATYYFAGETNSPDLKLNGSALRSQYAGGMDVLLGSGSQGGASNLAYYGGSGDDTAYAITFDAPRVTIAGRTTSTDLPLRDALLERLSGSSDAFIARFENLGSTTAAPVVNFATYLGGSGEEEIRGLAMPTLIPPVVSFAGTTTSTDFPVVNAVQAKYGGGASDAFAGRLDLTAHTLVYSTFIGGSGRDEAAGIGNNGVGDDVIAGSTTSPDLPVSGAFQDHLNGPQDAWVGALSAAGALQSLSYFGGSGSDRALAMMVTADNIVTIGGETDSVDLPAVVPNLTPTVFSGGVDGFSARMALPRFRVKDANTAWTGKGINTLLGIYLSGDVPDTAQITVTSSDPSRVLVSLRPGATPVPRISVPFRALGRSSGTLPLLLAGVGESGESEVTVDIGGVGTQKITVRLAPVVVYALSDGTKTIYLDQRLLLSAYIGVVDDSGRFVFGTMNPGVRSPVVTYSVSDPSVATLARTTYDFTDPIDVRLLQRGQVTVSAECDGATLAGPSSVTYTIVAPKISLADFALGKDLQIGLGFRSDRAINDLRYRVTLTTDSPDKVCFPIDSGECVRTTSGSTFPGIPIRGVADSGSAVIHFSGDNLDGGEATVQLTPPKLFFSANLSALRLVAGSAAGATIQFGSTLDKNGFATTRPGLDPGITVTSSDPKILSITDVAGNGFQLQPLAPGRLTLTATAPGFISADPVTLTVTPAAPAGQPKIVTVGRLALGKDLQFGLSYYLPNGGARATARSSAPARLSLTTDPSQPGGAQVDANGTIYLQGLSAEGTATVTLSAPGYADTEVAVQLAPSGYAWTTNAIAARAFGSTSLRYALYALDPDTLIPVAAQQLRPGAAGVPSVVNLTPAAGDVTTDTGGLSFVARGPGRAMLSLEQPDGFTTPAVRSTLAVIINPATIRANIPVFLGKDLQSLFTADTDGRVRLTIRSEDPSRLLVSADAKTLGSGQIDVDSGSSPIYLQALASGGNVTLRITGNGVQEAAFPIALAGAGVVLSAASTQITTYSPDLTMTASLMVDAPFVPAQGPGAVMLRPGVAPVEIPVTSTDPNVVRPLSSAVTFTPGGASMPTFNVRPQDPGEAFVRLSPPAAFHTTTEREQVLVKVGRPSFRSMPISVGRDLAVPVPLQIDSSVSLPGAILLTFISSDPSRVLLGTSPGQPGQERIVVPYGSSSGSSVLVYGIAEGSATVTVSTSGFDDARYDVTVTAPTIFLSAPDTVFIGQQAQVTVGLNGASVRPGGRIAINLRSSTPAVATVQSPLVIDGGKFQGSAEITALSEGRATITADGEGFAAGSILTRSFNVSLPGLPFASAPATYAVGNGLQVRGDLSYRGAPQTKITIASSDAAKVVLSVDGKAPGQGTITVDGNQAFGLYIQGRSDSGSATLTFSSPGYATRTATVNLYPVAFAFDRSVQNVTAPNTFDFAISPVLVTPTGVFANNFPVMTSAVTLPIVSSQPGVGTIKPVSVTINAGENRGTATFTPVAKGTTILTITPPAGFAAGNPPSQMVVTVN